MAISVCIYFIHLGEIALVMSREFRGNDKGDKLNFLGGKRLRKQETALEVALRKTKSETGNKLSWITCKKMEKPPLVFYSAPSKYVLFLVEVDNKDKDIDIRCAGLRLAAVAPERLEWVTRSELYSSQFVR